MRFEVAARLLENSSIPAPVIVLKHHAITTTYRGIAAYILSLVIYVKRIAFMLWLL